MKKKGKSIVLGTVLAVAFLVIVYLGISAMPAPAPASAPSYQSALTSELTP